MISFIVGLILTLIACRIDLKRQVVPNWLTISGFTLGLALSFIFPNIHNVSNRWASLLISFASCIFVILFMCWYSKITENVLCRETLGGGDIKLFGALASIINWKVMFGVLFISPFVGLIMFGIKRLKHEIYSMPYCPSIFIAYVISMIILS